MRELVRLCGGDAAQLPNYADLTGIWVDDYYQVWQDRQAAIEKAKRNKRGRR